MKNLRAIAIHLPQFHPIAENNDWWGKGFTEWSNVTKAKPLFKGHYQPQLPADFGFYDLRLEESRLAQEALAKKYGIYGFCYYHYWFNGKRLLNDPIDRKLKNPKEDLPFMLCWANENWSRKWDGNDQEILIEQRYSEEDGREHIRFLCKHMFTDARYIKVEGKPFISIYRPSLFPNIKKTIKTWREEAEKSGIGKLYIVFTNSFQDEHSLEEFDADACVEFAPHFTAPKRVYHSKFTKLFNWMRTKKDNAFDKIGVSFLNDINIKVSSILRPLYEGPYEKNSVYSYSDMVDMHSLRKFKRKTYPSLFPSWDNSPRKKNGNAYIFKNSTPNLYGKWLTSIINRFEPFGKEENFIFINAWNEWAEGNHLEPCQKWGLAYLEETKKAFKNKE